MRSTLVAAMLGLTASLGCAGRTPRGALSACRPCLEVDRGRGVHLATNPINFADETRDWEGPAAFSCGPRFAVLAHSMDAAAKTCRLAERIYPPVLAALGFPHRPGAGLYPVEIYRDGAEFRRQTGDPEWSTGQTYWNIVRTFDSPRLDAVLAHELTHLVVMENLRFFSREGRWLDEGLAAMAEGDLASESGNRRRPCSPALEEALSFSDMESFRWWTADGRAVGTRWHAQAASVARFLTRRCGTEGMRALLHARAEGKGVSAAVAEACPGHFSGLEQLELEWRESISQDESLVCLRL